MANTKSLAAEQGKNLASIRRLAMRLLDDLEVEASAAGDKADAAGKAAERAERLARRERIESLNRLALVVTRVIGKERESFGGADEPVQDEAATAEALDRRLLAEFDRVAARLRTAGSAESDRADAL